MEEEKTPDNPTSFEQHPFYRQAMEQIAAGDDKAAVANLRRLTDLYPDEGALRDLLVRTELRTAFVVPEEMPVQRSRPTPILRQAILFLMFVAILLAGVMALVAFGPPLFGDEIEAEIEQREIADQWGDLEYRLETGDLVGARQVLEILEGMGADGQRLQDAYLRLEDEELLTGLYEDGAEAQRQGRWQDALDLFLRLWEMRPDYQDVAARIEQLRRLEALEAAWQEAEGLVQAEDWLAALSRLTWIRGDNPEFRRGQVEERLFQIYSLLARQELDQAHGDVDGVRSALEYLREALILRPMQQDLKAEQKWARAFVAGFEARAAGDWVATVEAWEPIYGARQDYQGGVLANWLGEAYPHAADQLLERANGDAAMLDQSVAYLEQALIRDPENQELLAKRHFALEYLAGAEAFAKERWAEAIEYWGPIHDLRPDYQGGSLEENLKTSCANSPTPSETWCP